MKKTIILSVLLVLVSAVHVNAQKLALYAGGGYGIDLVSVESDTDQFGNTIGYKGGSGIYVDAFASSTLRKHIELSAGIRAFRIESEITRTSQSSAFTSASVSTTSNPINIIPQIGIGYNRNALLSIRAGLLAGYDGIHSIQSNSFAILTPYASVGYRNIMLNATFSYSLGKMLQEISGSHAKILTLGVIYHFSIIK